MIDFENAKVRKWIAVRKRIEAGAEDDVLLHAARDGIAQCILSETAAHREEGAKIRRDQR
jgi:hypothetical protein